MFLAPKTKTFSFSFYSTELGLLGSWRNKKPKINNFWNWFTYRKHEMLLKKNLICCTKQQLMKKRQSFLLPIFFSHLLSNIHLSDAGYCFATLCSIPSLCRYFSCFYTSSYTLIVFSSHFSFSFCSTTLFSLVPLCYYLLFTYVFIFFSFVLLC